MYESEVTWPVDQRLKQFFQPKSIAIVGASGREENPFSRPSRFLPAHGYAGKVYLVNPRYAELAGAPCYPRLRDVPGPVDLVLIMVAAEQAVDVIGECADVGAQAAIVYASGFAEVGPEGGALQDRLVYAARDAGVRVLGPNCQGVVYSPDNVVATFSAAAQLPLAPQAGVAYLGQSGAVGGSLLDIARERGLGFTAWVSTGNQCETSLIEIGQFLLNDSEISILALYVEAIEDPIGYIELARRARGVGKRLVLLRSGRSHVGRRAVASHTGAMLAPDAAFDLVSREEGVVLVDDVDELLSTSFTLASVILPAGNRVGIVSTSGGAGSLVADHCDQQGLVVDELEETTQRALRPLIPEFGTVSNPVDVTAQILNGAQDAFLDICLLAGRDRSVDLVTVLVTMVPGKMGRQLAEAVVQASRYLDKPVLVVWLAGLEQTDEARRLFRAARLPVLGSIGELVGNARRLVDCALHTDRPRVGEPPPALRRRVQRAARTAAGTQERALVEADCARLLDAVGIQRPSMVLAHTKSEAQAAAREIGGPVALKIQSSTVTHKTELDGLRLGIPIERVGQAYDELLPRRSHGQSDWRGMLVQGMAPPGHEMIVGVTRSQHGFPSVLTVGAGGMAAEVYRDVTSRTLPVNKAQVSEMLRELSAWPLLAGYRGQAVADIDALADATVHVGILATSLGGRLEELEINPLIVHSRGTGVTAVDCLMRLAADPERESGPEGRRH